jgi:hypothetical protein
VTIEKQIMTPVVCLLAVMSLENLLMPHSTRSFIVGVDPTFSITTISVWVELVNRMPPALWDTMMIEYAIQLVAPRLRASWFRAMGVVVSRPTKPWQIVKIGCPWWERKREDVPGRISRSGVN